MNKNLPRWEPLSPDQYELVMPGANGIPINTGLIVSQIYLNQTDDQAHTTIRDHFRQICNERGWDVVADVPELPQSPE